MKGGLHTMRKFSNRVKRMAFFAAIMMILSNIAVVVDATENDTTVTGAEILENWSKIGYLEFDNQRISNRCLQSLYSLEFEAVNSDDYYMIESELWDLWTIYLREQDSHNAIIGIMYFESDTVPKVGESVNVTKVVLETSSYYYVARDISITLQLSQKIEGKEFFENRDTKPEWLFKRISNRGLENLYPVEFEAKIVNLESLDVITEYLFSNHISCSWGEILFNADTEPKIGEAVIATKVVIIENTNQSCWYVAENLSIALELAELKGVEGQEIFYDITSGFYYKNETQEIGVKIEIDTKYLEKFRSLTYDFKDWEDCKMEGDWIEFHFVTYDRKDYSGNRKEKSGTIYCKTDEKFKLDKTVTITEVFVSVNGEDNGCYVAENTSISFIISTEKKFGNEIIPNSTISEKVKFEYVVWIQGKCYVSEKVNTQYSDALYSLEFVKVKTAYAIHQRDSSWYWRCYNGNSKENAIRINFTVANKAYQVADIISVQNVIVQLPSGEIYVAFDPNIDVQPVMDQYLRLDTEPSTETETEPETETDTEPSTETETEPGTETDTEPNTKPNSETNSEYESETGNKKTVIIIACSSFIVIIAIVIIVWRMKKRS